MNLALHEAKMLIGEIPVGAVLVQDNKVIAQGGNATMALDDATAHAEMIVIKKGHEITKTRFLTGCDLYTTLEPCSMCAGAISLSRIRRLYFGAYDEKGGAVVNGAQIFNYCNHKPEVYGGIMEAECSRLIKEFFQKIRH